MRHAKVLVQNDVFVARREEWRLGPENTGLIPYFVAGWQRAGFAVKTVTGGTR